MVSGKRRQEGDPSAPRQSPGRKRRLQSPRAALPPPSSEPHKPCARSLASTLAPAPMADRGAPANVPSRRAVPNEEGGKEHGFEADWPVAAASRARSVCCVAAPDGAPSDNPAGVSSGRLSFLILATEGEGQDEAAEETRGVGMGLFL